MHSAVGESLLPFIIIKNAFFFQTLVTAKTYLKVMGRVMFAEIAGAKDAQPITITSTVERARKRNSVTSVLRYLSSGQAETRVSCIK